MNGFNLSNIQNAMLGSTQVSALYYGSKLIWENYHDYSIEYFTIEPTTSDGADVYVTKGTRDQSVNLSYSTDLINWTSVTINTYGYNYTLLDHVFYGDKMYIKGINNVLGTSAGAGVRIYAIEPYKVYGNIMSLLYGDNFANQTSLPDHYSFVSLFNNSDNGLTDASNLILPATTLTGYCYQQMFQNCKQLTNAPVLPATTLYTNCYYAMFRNCTSLTKAPALPATTLTDYCYYNMFVNCKSLINAPVLPATTLAPHCYQQMFQNCTSLMYIMTFATDISATYSHTDFTNGVNTTGGTFIKNYNTQWPTGSDGIPSGWNVSNIYNVNIDNSIVGGTITSNIAYSLPNETVILTVTPDPHCTLQSLTVVDANDNPITVTNNQFTMPNSNVTVSAAFNINYNEMYLTIESLEDNNDIGWKSNNSTTKTIQWSTDEINWTSVTSSTTGELLATLNTGDKLYIKGTNNTYGATWNTWSYFTSTKTFNVYGNIMSMIYGDNFANTDAPSYNCMFWRMFINTGVVDASHLIFPATVRSYMYVAMFADCTSLTGAPAIPNSAAYMSFNSMFVRCTSLTTGPVVRANPGTYSYRELFDGCTSLNSVTVYATNLGSSGFTNWVRNVAASGTFTKLASMTSFPTGNDGIPSGWTVEDIHDYPNEYLTIESQAANNTISWVGSGTFKTIYYSTDLTNWNSVTATTSGTTIVTLNAGDKVYIKGTNNAYGMKWSTSHHFSSTDTFNVYGHINSLIYGDNFTNNKNTLPSDPLNFFTLFQESKVVDASNLILPNAANELTYGYMFGDCTYLTHTPEMPLATATRACDGMFRRCTSLTTGPVIQTNPGQYAYRELFDGCTSLNSITVYATSLGSSGFTNWVRNVAASGTFTKLASMTSFPSGASGIPSGWTVVDV